MTRYMRLRHDSTFRLAALVFVVLAGLALEPDAAGAAEPGAAIRPFTVTVPEAMLIDLRRRVAATRWPAARPSPISRRASSSRSSRSSSATGARTTTGARRRRR